MNELILGLALLAAVMVGGLAAIVALMTWIDRREIKWAEHNAPPKLSREE